MSCFERDTIVYAVNTTFDTLANSTQKCQDAASCEAAYCALSMRVDAAAICYSPSFLPPQTRAPDATWVLYVMLSLFLLYGAVMTLLYVRLRRQRPSVASYDDLGGVELDLNAPEEHEEQVRDKTQ